MHTAARSKWTSYRPHQMHSRARWWCSRLTLAHRPTSSSESRRLRWCRDAEGNSGRRQPLIEQHRAAGRWQAHSHVRSKRTAIERQNHLLVQSKTLHQQLVAALQAFHGAPRRLHPETEELVADTAGFLKPVRWQLGRRRKQASSWRRKQARQITTAQQRQVGEVFCTACV